MNILFCKTQWMRKIINDGVEEGNLRIVFRLFSIMRGFSFSDYLSLIRGKPRIRLNKSTPCGCQRSAVAAFRKL